MFWMACVVGLGVAYLLGSIPTGYLLGRMLKGIDIREHGSKSTGATNVLRTLGKGPGAVALLADALKGVAAVLVAGLGYAWLCAQPWASPSTGAMGRAMGGAIAGAAAWAPWAVCAAGLAALLGHAKSVWLGFSGGKSAATGVGVLLAMAWPVGLGAAAVFVAVTALSRRVSLGSMLGAVSAMVLVWLLPEPLAYRLLVLAGGLYVITLHRANIRRLLAGTEPALGQKA